MRKKVIIIAEAGVNHNGSIVIAKKLIDAAAKAGVDYIKFQTFKADQLVSRTAKAAEYQNSNLNNEKITQYEILKKLELSENQHYSLMEYCKIKNIKFFSTAFDIEGLEFLKSLGFEMFKVPSGEITNLPYLRKLADYGLPVILSTGMSNMKEIESALDVLTTGILKENITILHCNTEYPTPMQDVNLNAMISIKKKFDIEVGYSDHTNGIEVPIAAVAMGAKVIEKHFTIRKDLIGPDHKASLEPHELHAMVKSIRNIELALNGDGIKRPTNSELKNIHVARKSIFSCRDINKGEIIKETDLIALRPGDGISPMEWDSICGRTAKRNITRYSKIRKEDLQ